MRLDASVSLSGRWTRKSSGSSGPPGAPATCAARQPRIAAKKARGRAAPVPRPASSSAASAVSAAVWSLEAKPRSLEHAGATTRPTGCTWPSHSSFGVAIGIRMVQFVARPEIEETHGLHPARADARSRRRTRSGSCSMSVSSSISRRRGGAIAGRDWSLLGLVSGKARAADPRPCAVPRDAVALVFKQAAERRGFRLAARRKVGRRRPAALGGPAMQFRLQIGGVLLRPRRGCARPRCRRGGADRASASLELVERRFLGPGSRTAAAAACRAPPRSRRRSRA